MTAGRSLLLIVPAVTVLVAAIWWIAENPPSTEPAPFEQSARSLAESLGNPANEQTTDTGVAKLHHVFARPLFTASRQPWRPKRVAAAKQSKVEQVSEAEVAIPEADLAGVSISPGTSKVLLVNRNTGAATWVEQGQQYESWTVAVIGSTDVTLRQGNSEAVLKLYPLSK